MEGQDISLILSEMMKRGTGSGTPPTGKLRWEYATYGIQEGYMHIMHRKPLDIEEYFQLFLDYRQRHIDDLRKAELRVY